MKLIIPYNRRLHPTFQKCLLVWESLWLFAARRTQGSRLPIHKGKPKCISGALIRKRHISGKNLPAWSSPPLGSIPFYPGVEPAGIRQILRDLLDPQVIQQMFPYIKNMTVGYAES